ncbi:MAG: hypothetical protein C4B58_06635 [Deltaproteobacteria bacterium]|nr:MAG: hypothetical protein C4B58_06635 [Deltaproteobacteria bacterium]
MLGKTKLSATTYGMWLSKPDPTLFNCMLIELAPQYALDISYKPLSALEPPYIAVVLHMAYPIWWLFPYMKYPDMPLLIDFSLEIVYFIFFIK